MPTGIGIRISIYLQAFLALVSSSIRLFSVGAERDVTAQNDSLNQEVDEMAHSVFATLLTGAALVISGIVQVKTMYLSVYHAQIMLLLSWITVFTAIVPYTYIFVESVWEIFAPDDPHRLTPKTRIRGFQLFLLHTLHLSFTAGFGLWLFTSLHTFDHSATSCTASTVINVLGFRFYVVDKAFRRFCLAVYGMAALPVLNITLITTIYVVIPAACSLSFTILMLAVSCRFWPAMRGRLLELWGKTIPIITLIIPCACAIIVLAIVTEQTIKSNFVQPGDGDWTLGQTLAVAVAAIPTLDLFSLIRNKFHITIVPHFLADQHTFGRRRNKVDSSLPANNLANEAVITHHEPSNSHDLQIILEYLIRNKDFLIPISSSSITVEGLDEAIHQCRSIRDAAVLLSSLEFKQHITVSGGKDH